MGGRLTSSSLVRIIMIANCGTVKAERQVRSNDSPLHLAASINTTTPLDLVDFEGFVLSFERGCSFVDATPELLDESLAVDSVFEQQLPSFPAALVVVVLPEQQLRMVFFKFLLAWLDSFSCWSSAARTAYGGGFIPFLLAQSALCLGDKQQHVVQHFRAEVQPHVPPWQG